MTPLLKAFDNALEERYSESERVYDANDGPALCISARCAEVGDLKIYDDGDELTVVIGELHHCHYSAYSYEGLEDERLLKAAHEAAAYVADILTDKVQITVAYQGERCIGSSTTYLDPHSGPSNSVSSSLADWFPIETRKDCFLWSGRVS